MGLDDGPGRQGPVRPPVLLRNRVRPHHDGHSIPLRDEVDEVVEGGTRGISTTRPVARWMVSAPFLIISSGTDSTFPPGQPPHVEYPTISRGSSAG